MSAEELKQMLDFLERSLAATKAIHPGVKKGTRELITHLQFSVKGRKLCPYTITSRRYSIWTLVRRYLDDPFNELIHEHADPTHWSQLKRFKLSEIHKVDPEPLFANCYLPIHDPDYGSKTESKCQRLLEWQKFFEGAIKSSQAVVPRPAASITFERTLDFVQADLLLMISRLTPRPQRPHHADDLGSRGEHTRRVQEFCELCWRPTEYVSRKESHPRDPSADHKNKRFCSKHHPSNSPTLYRTDHRYKRAFENEFWHQMRLAPSEYAIDFPLPTETTIAARRKAAYDLVHAGLHPPDDDRKRRYSLKEEVYVLKQEGMSQSDIARRLGISRQAVSKAWKRVQEVLRRRELALTRESGVEAFDPEIAFGKFLDSMQKRGRSVSIVLPADDEWQE